MGMQEVKAVTTEGQLKLQASQTWGLQKETLSLAHWAHPA